MGLITSIFGRKATQEVPIGKSDTNQAQDAEKIPSGSRVTMLKLYIYPQSDGLRKVEPLSGLETAHTVNLQGRISESIDFLRGFFGNGPHLRGCCGPFSELIFHDLSKHSKELTVELYQLGDVLKPNMQRHMVCIVRNKHDPNEAYLIDATAKQFESSKAKNPTKPFPIKENESFSKEVNAGIANLLEKGFAKLTPDLAEAYSSFFHSPNRDWPTLGKSIEPKEIRSADVVIKRINEKFLRLFNNTEKTPQDWIAEANRHYQVTRVRHHFRAIALPFTLAARRKE